MIDSERKVQIRAMSPAELVHTMLTTFNVHCVDHGFDSLYLQNDEYIEAATRLDELLKAHSE